MCAIWEDGVKTYKYLIRIKWLSFGIYEEEKIIKVIIQWFSLYPPPTD